MRVDDFHHRSSAGLGAQAGKWLSQEDYQHYQGLKQLKTQLLMQVEEERRASHQLRQQLSDLTAALQAKDPPTSTPAARRVSAGTARRPDPHPQ